LRAKPAAQNRPQNFTHRTASSTLAVQAHPDNGGKQKSGQEVRGRGEFGGASMGGRSTIRHETGEGQALGSTGEECAACSGVYFALQESNEAFPLIHLGSLHR